jgi:tetratricopeptide (TPR) repeat protein
LHVDEEAVDFRRKLVAADPELYQSLEHLALDLCAVGRHEEAVRIGEEFTGFRRKLAETDTLLVGEERVKLSRRAAAMCSTPSDDLASALYMLGAHLYELGRKEDALLACEEAVELRRNVQETGTMPVLCLANSLEDLGVYLRALGRHKESLSRAQEAVDLQRRLIATDSSDFRPTSRT